MKIKINDVVYKIDDGFTIEENYNETLDSASIRISHLPEEIENIQPFDNVVLLENDGTTKFRDFCIDNYDCFEEAINQTDTTFSYNIELFSITKKMENIRLPNLSITPRKNTEDKLSVIDYINRLKETYNFDWNYTTQFRNKFSNVKCVEMQWTTPTLREVLNDLTMLADCLAILKVEQNVEKIHFLDLTYTRNANSKPFNYKQKSMSSDDYISEIRMDLQNVMQTNVEGVNNVVTTTEFLTLTSDDYIITSDNCYLKTQFPILNIKHLWIICFFEGQNNDTIPIKLDLCNFKVTWSDRFISDNPNSLVAEKYEYDIKEVLYKYNIPTISGDIVTPSSQYNSEFYHNYQNFCLYFVRNTNKIEGFTNLFKAFLQAETSTLQYLKVFCSLSNLGLTAVSLLDADQVNGGLNSWFSTFFQIEYETTYNCVFQASKSDKPRNKRIITDNQTNAWVDAYSQGFLEYQKANRLGNLQKMYNQRVTNKNDLYVIGDKINDDIVFKTNYQIFRDHMECNAYTTKNYVLRDYFTGIKSKIRTWVNARDEAFIRHDLKKYYCEFSYTQNNDEVDAVNEHKNLAEYFLTPLTNDMPDNEPIKYILVDVIDENNNTYPTNTSKYVLNCITRLIGNSIVLTAGFEDNWIVDKHPNTGTRNIIAGTPYDSVGIITKNDIEPLNTTTHIPPHFKNDLEQGDIGGIATNYYRYCDENGEFAFIQLYFLNNLKISNHLVNNIGHYNSNNNFVTDNSNAGDFFMDVYNLPVIKNDVSNPYIFGIEMPLYKDNKEKPVISTQFEFCANDRSIVFTKLFLELQNIIRIQDYNIYFNLKMNFLDANNNVIFNDFALNYFDVSPINDYCCKIIYTGQIANTKYIEFCFGDKIILKYDITKNNDHSLYLNIRRNL